MLRDLVDRMPGEILVDLGDDARLDVGMKGFAQIGQRSRGGHDNKRLHVALANELLHCACHAPREAMLLEMVPVGGLDRGSLSHWAIQAARTIGALLTRGRILILVHLLHLQAWMQRIAVVAQEQGLAAVANKHERVVRDVQQPHIDAPALPAEHSNSRLPTRLTQINASQSPKNGPQYLPMSACPSSHPGPCGRASEFETNQGQAVSTDGRLAH